MGVVIDAMVADGDGCFGDVRGKDETLCVWSVVVFRVSSELFR